MIETNNLCVYRSLQMLKTCQKTAHLKNMCKESAQRSVKILRFEKLNPKQISLEKHQKYMKK